jgi:hypothetical protein
MLQLCYSVYMCSMTIKIIMNEPGNVECMHRLLFVSAIKQAKWLVKGTQLVTM